MKPRKRKYSKLIEKSAKNAGISAEEFYKSIEDSIEESMHSDLPSAKEFWSTYPRGYKPTPEEFILRLVQMTENELKTK